MGDQGKKKPVTHTCQHRHKCIHIFTNENRTQSLITHTLNPQLYIITLCPHTYTGHTQKKSQQQTQRSHICNQQHQEKMQTSVKPIAGCCASYGDASFRFGRKRWVIRWETGSTATQSRHVETETAQATPQRCPLPGREGIVVIPLGWSAVVSLNVGWRSAH